MANDEFDEFVLVGSETTALEELFECFRGGLPVHTRQRTHEKSEALAGFTGLSNVFGGPDTGFEKQSFEWGEIVRSKPFVATNLSD